MEFGLGVLRLAPRDFWSMTIREIERAWAGYQKSHGQAPEQGMTRARLEQLKAMYPDT